jgi:hypothetical protein
MYEPIEAGNGSVNFGVKKSILVDKTTTRLRKVRKYFKGFVT